MHLNYLPVKKPGPFIKPTFVLVQRQAKPQKQTLKYSIQFKYEEAALSTSSHSIHL